MLAHIDGILMDVTSRPGKTDPSKIFHTAHIYEGGDYPKTHRVNVRAADLDTVKALLRKQAQFVCLLFVNDNGVSLSFKEAVKA